MKKFYITTPIYYVNDKPHAGTSYSTVIADILNRYHQFFKKQTFFLTGIDEHGQKCRQAAQDKGLPPQTHCDQMAEIFKKYWKILCIQYNHFYRTTSPSHKKSVQKALQKLFDSGHIYESTYEGWYCVSEEIFYTQKDLINGLSPYGKKVTKIKEKNYFFKMSQFKNRLIEHLEKNPHFIYPPHRQNEVLGFLNQGLEDLCISRPTTRLKWGIPLPFDPHYVVYVWIDALLNYVFAIDLWKNNQNFHQWWENSHHLIGKDILITHAVYWPCLLMALEIPLPKHIISHGWLLNKEQEKMSKSKGKILDPLDLIDLIGSDPLRYFFIKSVRLGQDSPISPSLIVKEYNQDLANNLGNLFQRTITLISSYFDSKIPPPIPQDFNSKNIHHQALKTCDDVKDKIFNLHLHKAMFEIMKLLDTTNRYLENTAPWKLIQSDKQKTALVLRTSLEVLRISASLLQPVIPQSSQKILNKLGLHSPDFDQTKTWNALQTHLPITKEKPLFPRIQLRV